MITGRLVDNDPFCSTTARDSNHCPGGMHCIAQNELQKLTTELAKLFIQVLEVCPGKGIGPLRMASSVGLE